MFETNKKHSNHVVVSKNTVPHVLVPIGSVCFDHRVGFNVIPQWP